MEHRRGASRHRPPRGAPMTATETSSSATASYKFLEGNFAPVARRGHRDDCAVTGTIPAALAAATCATGPTPSAADRPVPLVHRRRHGARRRAARRPGRVVPQPLGAHADGRRARWGRPTVPGPTPPHGTRTPTRTWSATPGRILRVVEAAMPYELTPELDTIGRTRLRRHAARPASPRTRRSIPSPASCTAWRTRSRRRTCIYHVIDAVGHGSCAASRSRSAARR